MCLRDWIRLAVASAALGLACATSSRPLPLKIGSAGDYAPLSFLEAGELRGAEIDFARRLAADLGRSPEIVRLPFVELIPALRDGRIDVIMSGMSITSDRAELVRFCAPYLQVGQMALIRSSEWVQRSEPDAIARADSKIGFLVGTTGEAFARSSLGNTVLVSFDSIDAGIAALRAEKIDYFVHDAPTIWRVVGGFRSDEKELTGLYTPLTDERLAWAVRREDAVLADSINAVLSRWLQDGRVEGVLDRWIPVRKVSAPASGNP